MQNITERKDVYSRITTQIVEYLEKGVRPWIRHSVFETPKNQGAPNAQKGIRRE
jgi:antirestriction protein ArdC